MLSRPYLWIIYVVVAFALLWPTAARATDSYLSTWSGLYPNSTLDNTYSCNICHEDIDNSNARNSYGADMKSASGSRSEKIRAVEQKDSDGDTFLNSIEILANTHPGLASDFPDIPKPEAPFGPVPASGAVRQPTPLTLSWQDGGAAETYDVYLALGSAALQRVSQNQTARSYSATGLTLGATYHWRVDAKNVGGTRAGPEWTFTVMTQGGALYARVVDQDPYGQWGHFPGLTDARAGQGQAPHGAKVRTFINAAAAAALDAQPEALPDDSILVVENYSAADALQSLSVMWKKQGFDAGAADWFWAQFGADGSIAAEGRVASCAACHGAKSGNDYIFQYLLQEPTSGTALYTAITQSDPYGAWGQFPAAPGMRDSSAPHGPRVRTFINAEAQGALGAGTLPYGSILVKENYTAEETLSNLTVMWKVQGFNPTAGDWFWAQFDASGATVSEGKVASCISCHAPRAANDYVFQQDLSEPQGAQLYHAITQTSPYSDWAQFPSAVGRRAAQAPHGPRIQTFVNPTAEAAMEAYHGALPPGSMVVAERYSDAGALEALYVMSKVEGYAPASGDWFWVEYGADGAVATEGRTQTCIECHGQASGNDYVFQQAFTPSLGWQLYTRATGASPYTLWDGFPEAVGIRESQAPHGAKIKTFVNPIGLSTLDVFSGRLSDDSIVLAENYDAGETLQSLTAMWKVRGLRPETHDWYWAQYSPAGEVLTEGSVTNCADCHAANADNDYVHAQAFADAPTTGSLYDYLMAQNYRSWPQFPETPGIVAGSEHGASVRTFVNDEVASAFDAFSGSLAPGSLIVLEELSAQSDLSALAVMYKVEGYAPEMGDWYWARYDAAGTILAEGKMAAANACAQCHGTNADTNDYVYQRPFDTPSANFRQLVDHFYRAVLGRAPESGVVDIWETGYYDVIKALDIDVRFAFRELGRQFFLSDEYLARARGDADFIRDCYGAFLMREPSGTEIDPWLQDIDPDSGNVRWNRGEVMTRFAESVEFAERIERDFPAMEGAPGRNFVTAMYIGVFDRLVDSGGLEYWAGQMDGALDKNLAARQMATAFFASEEGQAKAPTDAIKAVRLYRAFLGRFPADSEVAHWSDRLASGAESLDSLIGLFGASAEFKAILNRYY